MSLVFLVRFWKRRLLSGQRKQRPITRSRRLDVESLEQRTVPSATLHPLSKLPAPHPAVTLDSPPSPGFVTGLYYDVLNRQPTQSAVNNWMFNIHNNGLSRYQVALEFVTSPEYLSRMITNDYHTFLGRNPEPGAVNSWLNQVAANGLSEQQVTAAFLLSNEYFTRQGGTNSGWVSGLYHDVLSRAPESAGFHSWSNALANGSSRQTVATGFVNSHEEARNNVAQAYQTILGRAPDAGAAGWAASLVNGMSLEGLLASLASSSEYSDDQSGVDLPVIDDIPGDNTNPTDGTTGNTGAGSGQPGTGDQGGGNMGGQGAGNAGNGGGQNPGGPQDGIGGGVNNGGQVGGGGNNAGNPGAGNGGNNNGGGGAGGGGGDLGGGGGGDLGSGGLGGGGGSLGGGGGVNGGSGSGGAGTGGGSSNTGGGGNTGGSGGGLTGSGSGSGSSSGHGSGSGGGGTGTGTSGTGTGSNTGSTKGVLTVGPNIDVNRQKGEQSEVATAINPTNPLQMFAFANDNASTNNTMTGAFSSDGGKTWTEKNIPNAFSDPTLSWDEFGNLFLAYIDFSSQVSIQLSTDGGKNFKNVGTIKLQDQPTVVAAHKMVWVTFNNGDLEAAGANVTGLGQVGAFGAVLKVPNSQGQNFGDIVIGPNGEVAMVSQDSGSGAGPDKINFTINKGGISGSFSNLTVATKVNVGGFRPIPAQPSRTIDAESGLAYDRSGGPHNGRLYLIYTDAADTTTNDTNIFLRISDDNGKTWSAAKRVNDDTGTNSQFFSKIAVDQSSGNVGMAWYDCRNDTGSGAGDTNGKVNDDAEIFATISLDNGQTFQPNVQVAVGPSNSVKTGDPNEFGDYIGLAYVNGELLPGWTDNDKLIAANPDLPTADIVVSVIITPGGTGGVGGGGTGLPDDRFELNETSDQATQFGILTASQKFNNLTINHHADGLPDYDWYRWTAGQNGTLHIVVNYQSPTGGDIHIRVFTLTGNTMVEIASSRLTGVTQQGISVAVGVGEPLLLWVYGFKHADAAYTLSDSIT